MLIGPWVALHSLENILASVQKPDFVSLLEQNLCDGGQLKLPRGCLGMQSHCLDPYGCNGSVKSMSFDLWAVQHGLENILALAQKPDFASLLQQNLCDGGQLQLPRGLLGM